MAKNVNKIKELISEICPEGVEFLIVDETCSIRIGDRLEKSAMFDNGNFPVYGGGVTLTGRYDKNNTSANSITIGRRGTIGFVNFILEDFWGTSNLFIITPTTNRLINKFVYYAIKVQEPELQRQKKVGGTPAIDKPDIKKIKIPVPPLAVQKEIVKILDNFTKLEAKLEAELEARKKQYEYYRKELMLSNNEGDWKTLGDIYDFQYGKGNTIPNTGGKYPVYGGNRLAGQHNKYNSEDAPVIGHIGAYAGIVNWVDGKHFVTYNGVICKIKANINPKYGYYLLLLQNFRSQAHSGSQPFISYEMLNKTIVQIPDLPHQNSIVAKLDKFKALVSDISIGLPTGLKARRSQYRYYRGKLLTFKEKEYAKQ